MDGGSLSQDNIISFTQVALSYSDHMNVKFLIDNSDVSVIFIIRLLESMLLYVCMFYYTSLKLAIREDVRLRDGDSH